MAGGRGERFWPVSRESNPKQLISLLSDRSFMLIVRRGKGFIYYVSREGVTGMQSTVSDSVGEMTAIIRQNTNVPIAVGFGISNPKQVAQVAQNADAVVVGSAIVNQIAEKGKSMDLVSHVKAFTADLITGIR